MESPRKPTVEDVRSSRAPGGIVGGTAALALAIAMAIIAPWEGRELTPYRDIVGVWTVCDGHTGGVQDRKYTPAECDKLLASDTAKAYALVRRCITRDLPPEMAAAFTSLAFNVGPKGVCGSTLQRHANAGNFVQACGQLMRWVYAGGKRVKGLVNRRQAEYRLCMKPLTAG